MTDWWSQIRNEALHEGQRVKDLRWQQNLSLQGLVDKLGILGRPSLSRIERGIEIPLPHEGEKLTEWMLQSLPGITPPPTRATDPDTSRQAAESVKYTTIGQVHRWWLHHLNLHSTMDPTQLDIDGMEQAYWTTDAGAWELFKYNHPQLSSESGFRTRRSELVKQGLAADSGLQTKNRTGRNVTVWTITTLGQEVLSR